LVLFFLATVVGGRASPDKPWYRRWPAKIYERRPSSLTDVFETGTLYIGLDRRAFSDQPEPEPMELDLSRAYIRLGRLFPKVITPESEWLCLFADFGISQAELGLEDGELGFSWGAGLEVRPFPEHVAIDSPTMQKQGALEVKLSAAYQRTESDFANREFNYSEVRLMAPHLTYISRPPTDLDQRQGYKPESVALHTALLFLPVSEGELGDRSIDGERDFGVHVGLDFAWIAGYKTILRGNFYGSSDREIRLAFELQF